MGGGEGVAPRTHLLNSSQDGKRIVQGMKVLRIGIVGCGKIADGHAEILKFLDGAQLVAVCDREPILAEQLAVRFGVPAWYSSLDQMLAAERLDVVHITTPPG